MNTAWYKVLKGRRSNHGGAKRIIFAGSSNEMMQRKRGLSLFFLRLAGWLFITSLALGMQVTQAATYSYTNVAFAYDTPSGAATTAAWHATGAAPACTTYPLGDDDWADVAFPAGFTFTFGGVSYSGTRIYSNGMLAFGTDTSGYWRQYSNLTLPITAASANTYAGCTNTVPVNLMSAYWTDIVAGTANATTGASVQYEMLGTAPNRRFVISWVNVKLYNTTTRYNFQIALYESAAGINGIFKYNYTTGSSTGSAATVGVQLTTADYTLYSFNQAFIDTVNGTSILWSPQTTLASSAGVYHFDEASWNGTAGQVIDSSGNLPAQNATSVGAANTVATTKCGFGRAGSFPANTSNTVISAVATPITPTNTGSIDFWYYSNAAWNTGPAAMLFDATTVATKPFYLMKTATGALQFTVSDSAGTISTTTSAAQTFAANTWQHVGVSWVFLAGTNQTYIQIFLNGALLTSARYTTTGTIAALSTLYIGDNRTSGVTPSAGSPNSANGLIDEVKVYTAQINAFQAASDMSCVALIDHLLIRSFGTGLTCAANTLTIVACQNAACSVNYTAGVIGTLAASGPPPTVNWDGTTGGAAGAGFATGGTGTAAKNVQVATAGTVTFGIISPTPVPTNATACNFGNNSPANNNCVFTASTAGFIFSNTTAGTSYTIPAQVSGIATTTALTPLFLRALQASTTNPAVCTPAIISSTTSVNMGYSCNNPVACQAGNLATITNATTSTSTSIAPAGTAVSLNFDANGSAPINVRYDDVGQITLNANATVTPFTGATAITLNGSSNAFVVAPHHFGFSAVTAAPIKAGNNFSANVTAYNGLATPTATKNFGQETPAAESAALALTKCQPTGTSSSSGTFSGNVGAFTAGTASASNLNWSDVGNGDLVATLASGSYLGSGLTATGNTGTGGTTCTGAGNVGRFIPDHFDTVVVNGCLGCGFTYSGQPFNTVTVTAKNGLGTPTTTVNYDGTVNTAPNFAKATTLSAWDAATGAISNPGPGTLTPPSNTAVALTAFVSGMATLSTPATPAYTFTAIPTPPTVIRVRAIDTDNVTSLRAPLASSTEGQPEIRSGRINLSNAYGSELLQLPITATAQYWTSTGYVTSITDSATQFNTNLSTAGGNVLAAIVKGPLAFANVSVVTPGLVTFANGVNTFKLGAPNVVGSVNLSIVTAPSYLLPSTTGRATFGVYKGANEFIYLRENY
jgi:MSHA biogenesis protein MshQ